MTKRILGIDTGTNSLGWAVVDKKDNGEFSLVRKGSLIFQEGVKIEKGIESSKAAERTSHRALRKQYFRRRLRKIEVLKVLIKYGWCPYLTDDQLQQWHTKKLYPQSEAFMSWQRTNDNLEQNPYYYRHVCLHDELDLDNEAERYMLGRALYHLAQRRGFLSNRLDQSEEDDSGAVKGGISELSKQMEDAGCEYLGDYFYKLYSEEGNKVRIRTRYTDREQHYKKEFYAICKKQQLSEVKIKELECALYFQRPLKNQRQGVGKCTFEPRKQRCADSHPDYERFRLLSFVNNIKVMGPYDVELRPLNSDEIAKALPMFYRKSKPNFDFEDIAKAIAGKGKYQHIKDAGDKPYKFNYRMTQSTTGCPTIANLMSIFGEDYENAISEVYTLGNGKSSHEMLCDVWNVLYSFADNSKVIEWAKDKLQLDDEKAEKFSKIKLTHSFASLSLSAIRKILPFLEEGMIYSHAVSMAKVPDIVGKEIWEKYREDIKKDLKELIVNFNPKDESMQGTLDFCIKDYLLNNYDLEAGAADKLYHPSMIETYPDAKRNAQGVYQLGSPRTNAIRNPMAMRSLHQLRKVVNQLLKEQVIDQNTEVHIEYARELSDSNKRYAIAQWNKEREKARKGYADEIIKLYKEATHQDIVPTETDILKFQLWEEQNHICLYTGEQIGIADFIGKNPKFDIEHTIPRSVGGDFTQENMTLCSSRYNREVKKAQIPTHLVADYDEIMARLEPWKQRIEKLRKDADRVHTHSGMAKDVKDRLIRKRHQLRLELEYWQGKYKRFTMTEIPEGFARRQGAGIGLVSKYAGLYLKTLFHRPEDRTKSNVRVVKGQTTAEFRKMWGIQDEYEKKSRDNHIHHCIDAITIACINPGEYNETARYYKQLEEYERNRGNKPTFRKPWSTFTEDIKALAQEMLVVHDTPDNMPKHAKKIVRTTKGKFIAKGDSARGSLHNDTYYGAIEKDGEIRYVKRVMLDNNFKESDAETIVDEAVKAKVKHAIAEKGLQKAMTEPIYMNEDKGIVIKKVRCYANSVKKPLDIRQHRDESKKEYKRQFHVTLDGNYCMAIYEGMVKGKTKRTYEIVNMLEASTYYKESSGLSHYYPIVPEEKKGMKYRCRVNTGTQIILLQSDEEELCLTDIKSISDRLYYVAIMQKDGRIILRHHQEAREATELKKESRAGAYKVGDAYRSQISLSLSDFHALVEGVDFKIDCLGNITLV